MTLTYSMVLERLDVVNHREKQVRKFYKPLPAPQNGAQRPWPRRHRFADVMEPGDVVKTMSKNKDDDWDPDEEYSGQEKREDSDVILGPGVFEDSTNETFEPATRPPPPPRFAPADNQPLLGYVSKVERKLKKSIELDVEERRKSLRAQLQKEMKGSEVPELDNLEPLFKPARTTASARKRLDIKSFCTDPASTRVSHAFS
jgi:hypothetical protein